MYIESSEFKYSIKRKLAVIKSYVSELFVHKQIHKQNFIPDQDNYYGHYNHMEGIRINHQLADIEIISVILN